AWICRCCCVIRNCRRRAVRWHSGRHAGQEEDPVLGRGVVFRVRGRVGSSARRIFIHVLPLHWRPGCRGVVGGSANVHFGNRACPLKRTSRCTIPVQHCAWHPRGVRFQLSDKIG